MWVIDEVINNYTHYAKISFFIILSMVMIAVSVKKNSNIDLFTMLFGSAILALVYPATFIWIAAMLTRDAYNWISSK